MSDISKHKEAQKLDLSFCTWEWNIEANTLSWNETDCAECCFEPFIEKDTGPSSGWERVLPRKEAIAFKSEILEKVERQAQFHGKIVKAIGDGTSLSIIIHGLVKACDSDGKALVLSGFAQPDYQLGSSGSSNDFLGEATFDEKRKLENLLLKTQRFEAVAKLAGGIAHDLNNLMAPIRMATELMQRKLPDDSCERYLTIIKDSTDRARSIIQQILTFSKGSEEDQAEFLDPNDIIWELKNMVSETFPPRVHLDFKLGHLPHVQMDPGQLHQAILNILINARDAIDGNGHITVKSYIKEFDLEVRIGDKIMNQGRYACIAISDDGHGIPSEIRDKIFDPFFTTKQKNEGTGLGLASVYGIFARAGGFIDLESNVGEGSTFYLYLPEVTGVSENTVEEEEDYQVDLSGMRTLIIDDEENILQTLIHCCKDWHMDVLGFSDPSKALDYVRSKNPAFDFAIIDLHMPGISGKELIQQLRESKSASHFYIITGDFHHELDEEFLDSHVAQLIHKPFEPKDLVKAFSKSIKADEATS